MIVHLKHSKHLTTDKQGAHTGDWTRGYHAPLLFTLASCNHSHHIYCGTENGVLRQQEGGVNGAGEGLNIRSAEAQGGGT